MSKEKFAELLKDEQPEPQKEPLTLSKILGEAREIGGAVWDASKPMIDHGSAELASALFNGHAHVPYGWSHASEGQEADTHGQSQSQQQQDRGGREM